MITSYTTIKCQKDDFRTYLNFTCCDQVVDVIECLFNSLTHRHKSMVSKNQHLYRNTEIKQIINFEFSPVRTRHIYYLCCSLSSSLHVDVLLDENTMMFCASL